LKARRNSTNMMMKVKSSRKMPMIMTRQNKKQLGAKATTRAQISYDKLLNTTKRTSSYNTRRDRKRNKKSSNTKKSRLKDAEKKR
jgi:hypothetical protein